MLTGGRGQERGTCGGLWAGDERNHTALLPSTNGSEMRSWDAKGIASCLEMRRTENKGSPLVSCLYFSSSEADSRLTGRKDQQFPSSRALPISVKLSQEGEGKRGKKKRQCKQRIHNLTRKPLSSAQGIALMS